MDLQTLINTVKVASQSAGISFSGTDKFNKLKKSGSTLLTSKNLTKINSLKGKARGSIAQYPVLVSENINPKLVPIITNALEVEYSSLVWLVISSTSSFNSGDSASVIKQFHNVQGGLTESTFLCGVDSTHQLYEANKELLESYEDTFNMKTLNESYYTGSLMEYLAEAKGSNPHHNSDSAKQKEFEMKVKEHQMKVDDSKRKQKEFEMKVDDNRRKEQEFANKQTKFKQDQEDQLYSQRMTRVKDALGTAKDTLDIATSVSREIDRKRDFKMSKKKFDDDQAQRNYMAGKAEVLTTMRDLNKVNDLHPTILNIEVNFREPETKTVVTKKLSIGVKCVSHLLKSDDIQYYLTKASYKNSGLLKLVKWTTGEIKFWKDLVFNLDDLKMSIIQNRKNRYNKNYFANLEFIAKASKQAVLTGAKTSNLPSAITTLVISKTDVDNIKYKDGINLLANPEYLKKIFNAYYLLNILIVDESLDVIYSYDQFTNTIHRQPFSSYEKASKERVINANDLFKLAK